MGGKRAVSDANLATDPHGGFHYEFSNDFYRLWLDATLTYSCAYFSRGDESLEEAQIAKIDLAFRKVGLGPGHRLLDIGCGWGAAAARAAERYGANSVGLTLSRNQLEIAKHRERSDLPLRYQLEGWETYREPCDRIVSFGAFEHFTISKYPAFFARCRELLPDDGMMLLQTITVGKPSRAFELLRFAYFLHKELFHRAELPPPETVLSHARLGGFELLHAESLRPHYVRTIEMWLDNLLAKREEAIEATDETVYNNFIRYLNGAARYHRSGETNVYQFLFRVSA